MNHQKLQLKTISKGSTKNQKQIGISLHKTHGNEKRPFNLYSKTKKTFDYLVVLHPQNGIIIIPYEDLPEHKKWTGYLQDPIIIKWNNQWINRWDLLGYKKYSKVTIENRIIINNSQLPQLSKETFLTDEEIIETLINPSYFRAAVMGLKGNLKEEWFINFLFNKGLRISRPLKAYSKYDLICTNNKNENIKVQVKGTSKNMCDFESEIGVEVMGTHGQFPQRGYKASDFDYLAIIISVNQISHISDEQLHFCFIPMEDLPLHYLIGNGNSGQKTGWKNEKWNLSEYSKIIYPNIKLSVRKKRNYFEIVPNLKRYRKYRGYKTIPDNSPFRKCGPYILDEIPNHFFE